MPALRKTSAPLRLKEKRGQSKEHVWPWVSPELFTPRSSRWGRLRSCRHCYPGAGGFKNSSNVSPFLSSQSVAVAQTRSSSAEYDPVAGSSVQTNARQTRGAKVNIAGCTASQAA
ncbi:hypothetical protein Y1Q_0019992 [Alligator mississippiensis]|uniref:Uncharacterized protein n=1 Tax=Alligator mississippiensis TaxID=8496 RepID=A0A151PEU4_ALLMI|nr:hypothetical protein Y1Q_0019992 [Alligator mississippiensis]